MNIKQATEQIRGAIRAYLSKDERGLLRIPFHMQRPIIMFGPPGVGKTAIVSQIAREEGINFISYSITHHTRQSALGLPYITTEEFDGREYRVSDYTMSEIIAAVHRAQKASGVDEGILFLDEVNCVSETLAPAMLQFLQYKTFGMHRLPEGWIIVTAGNPPEYNRAARDFDPAMLDRMKRIDVEPDLQVWQEYAASHGVHPAITTFLDASPGSFYDVRAGVRGAKLVTARGWEDLSRMILAYEAESICVDRGLVRQYLQDDRTANEFFAYYELFRKYRDDYKVPLILEGEPDGEMIERACSARFDERVALVGLLLDAVLGRAHDAMEWEGAVKTVRNDLLEMRQALEGDDPVAALEERIALAGDRFRISKASSSAVDSERVRSCRVELLESMRETACAALARGEGVFDEIRAEYNRRLGDHSARVQRAVRSIDNSFAFLDRAFGETSQESLIMATKLSADPVLVSLVASYGSAEYLKHNKSLLFAERGLDLLRQAEMLEGE